MLLDALVVAFSSTSLKSLPSAFHTAVIGSKLTLFWNESVHTLTSVAALCCTLTISLTLIVATVVPRLAQGVLIRREGMGARAGDGGAGSHQAHRVPIHHDPHRSGPFRARPS